jgi:4-alpha-glucanotransferase
MKFRRASGVILHPTSLPGPYGIGDLGSEAFDFVDFLVDTGCSLWQVLPLGPTGYADSPYQCFSAFAGNPYLVSPEVLLAEGLLSSKDIHEHPSLPDDYVDYGQVIPWKLHLLDHTYDRFMHKPDPLLVNEYEQFQNKQAGWLPDFSLFMALKEAHQGAVWTTWEPALRMRNPQALEEARRKYSDAIQRQTFRQFLFYRQWESLRAHANRRGVMIIGDAPIFVAHDSADVWVNPDLFFLDKKGNPKVVAGVPPDYFSPTGQLWGNPLYNWDYHAQTGYEWWLNRLKAVLQMVDIVRLDHFRGFAGYWEVPAGMPTAEIGRWVKGPGEDFFNTVKAGLGDLPLIAEDLGEITPDVFQLRDHFHLPGMKIFQFAFLSDPDDMFMPHNYPRNCVAYTGTHDNDTTLGWFKSSPEAERDFCLTYLGLDHTVQSGEFVQRVIRTVWASVAMFTLAPLQDLLALGTQARMNFPGKASGNWAWRMPEEALSNGLKKWLRTVNYVYGRSPKKSEIKAPGIENKAKINTI